jgi:hypothetical protein
MGLAFILNASGLVVTFCGAIATASGVIMRHSTAKRLGETSWDSNDELTGAFVTQSRRALVGLLLIALGAAMQFCALFI